MRSTDTEDDASVSVERCLFCFLGVTTLLVVFFHSPVAGFSLLISRFLDHTQRRATVGRTSLDE